MQICTFKKGGTITNIIKNLKIIRKQLNLTQIELANALGVNRSTISRIERNIQKPRKSVSVKRSVILIKKAGCYFRPFYAYPLTLKSINS